MNVKKYVIAWYRIPYPYRCCCRCAGYCYHWIEKTILILRKLKQPLHEAQHRKFRCHRRYRGQTGGKQSGRTNPQRHNKSINKTNGARMGWLPLVTAASCTVTERVMIEIRVVNVVRVGIRVLC